MENNRYVSVMLVGLSDAVYRGLLSPTEEKKLADNVMDNKQVDIFAAQNCEAKWNMWDIQEGVDYYKN